MDKNVPRSSDYMTYLIMPPSVANNVGKRLLMNQFYQKHGLRSGTKRSRRVKRSKKTYLFVSDLRPLRPMKTFKKKMKLCSIIAILA